MAVNNSTCSVSSCSRTDIKSGRYCGAHAQRVSKYGDPRAGVPIAARRPREGRSCTVPNCARVDVVGSSDFCYPHYKRAIRGTDLTQPLREAHTAPIPVRDLPNGDRVCQGCGMEMPLTSFHRDKRGPKGYRKTCKICRVARETVRYWSNPESHKLRMRDFRTRNIEQVRAREARYYEDNRDARIEGATEASHRRRASLYAAPRDRGITRSALRKMDGDDCCYCGTVMAFASFPKGERPDEQATVEHVVSLSRGGSHVWANCTLACWRCNISKGARDGGWRIRRGHRLAIEEVEVGS